MDLLGKRLVLAWIGLALFAGPASWAIDCGKAKSKIEKTICADAELMKLDESLNASFRKARLIDSKRAVMEIGPGHLGVPWIRELSFE